MISDHESIRLRDDSEFLFTQKPYCNSVCGEKHTCVVEKKVEKDETKYPKDE
jgi:hypothetical protein